MFWFAFGAGIGVLAITTEIDYRVKVRRESARVVAMAEQIMVEAAALRDVEERLWAEVDDDEQAG